jgi:NADPH:quinone reductase-like Zn-dependent oxidoreductase
VLKAEYRTRGPIPQDVIEAVEMTLDEPAPGQVRLEVLAAPINPSDVLTLTGEYGMLPELPAIGGNEGVGRVTLVGDGVDHLTVGDVVMLPPGSGTWRTHMNAGAGGLITLPADADPVQLSMLTVNPPTASLLLSEFVDLQPGEWVIQNAANSAVGGYLIQLAAVRGLKTANVVRRDEAIDRVLELGGDVCLVDGPGLERRVAEATRDTRIRLAIDAVAGEATGRLASTLAKGGTIVNYGAMSNEPCVIPSLSVIFNDLTLTGFWLARWFRTASAEAQASMFGEITRLISTGRLTARVAATYDVSEIKDAVRHAAGGGRDGKIVIAPDHS